MRVSGEAVQAEGSCQCEGVFADRKKAYFPERKQGVGIGEKRDKGQAGSCQSRQGVWTLFEEQQEALEMFQVDE